MKELLGGLLFMFEDSNADPSEFVGYVEKPADEVAAWLEDEGFEQCDDHGSWRRVEGNHQLHVTLYNGISFDASSDETYIFAHWEAAHDEKPYLYLRKKERSVSKGINEMRRHLNLASIPFYNDVSMR